MSLDATYSTRVTIVWLALVLATGMSWQLGHGMGFQDRHVTGIAILVIAILKVRFVILDFMGLRHAPLAFRIGVEVWSFATTVAIVTLYSRESLFRIITFSAGP